MSRHIISLFEKGFRKSISSDTINKFGLNGRVDTVGASDIGGCLRQSFLQKSDDKTAHIEISKLIKMQRGNIAENLVTKALKELEIEFYEQVEIKDPDNPSFKCHIDYLIKHNDYLHILEMKTTSEPLLEPYSSWIFQVQFQLKLLQKNYQGFNLTASIFAMDLNSGWYDEFDVEKNSELADIATTNANTLLKAIETKQEPKATLQNYCFLCDYRYNCNELLKESIDEKSLPDDVVNLIKEVKILKANDKIKKQKESKLKEIMQVLPSNKITVDGIVATLSHTKGRTIFDTKGFKEKHNSLYQQFISQSAPSYKLKVA